MADAQMVRLANRLQRALEEASALGTLIRESGHPNAQRIWNDLYNNEACVATDAAEIVHEGLEHPERWEVEGGRLRRVRAASARAKDEE